MRDGRGRLLGQAMVNLQSQIAGRLLTRDEAPVDEAFFHRRIQEAMGKHGRTLEGPGASRLVFGEADRLPGLIADRYGDLVVVQLLTAGMERARKPILECLRTLVRPRAIYERNDTSSRKLEGLPLQKGFAWGEGETTLWMEEEGLRFLVDVAEGQKTGFFLDQRVNYAEVAGLLTTTS